MNIHKNARLTPRGRERIVRQVESGQTPQAAAQAAGVCPRTIRKWVDRYRREGIAGPLVPAASAAAADASGGYREDRTAAPPALDGQTDRRRGWRLASDCQPYSAPAGLEQVERLGARAGAPL